jgi:transglutaminase-like putative cysteine protease
VRDYTARYPDYDSIDGFLRSVFRYRSENDEIVRTPDFMLNDLETLGYLEGDCDDIATLSASMLKTAGYPARLTAIKSTGPEEYDHVFAEAQVMGGWVPMDITEPRGTVYQVYGYVSELI